MIKRTYSYARSFFQPSLPAILSGFNRTIARLEKFRDTAWQQSLDHNAESHRLAKLSAQSAIDSGRAENTAKKLKDLVAG